MSHKNILIFVNITVTSLGINKKGHFTTIYVVKTFIKNYFLYFIKYIKTTKNKAQKDKM